MSWNVQLGKAFQAEGAADTMVWRHESPLICVVCLGHRISKGHGEGMRPIQWMSIRCECMSVTLKGLALILWVKQRIWGMGMIDQILERHTRQQVKWDMEKEGQRPVP